MTATQPLREELVQQIAAQLQEPDGGVVAQIRGIVSILGPQKTAVLVRAVVRLEQLGGCLILNDSRKRSAGGLFLILARGCMSYAQRAIIWPEYRQPETTEASEAQLSEASAHSIGTGAYTDTGRQTPQSIRAQRAVVNQQQKGVYHAPTEPHS